MQLRKQLQQRSADYETSYSKIGELSREQTISRNSHSAMADPCSRRQLLELDDRMLSDIGLTRCDVLHSKSLFSDLARHPE